MSELRNVIKSEFAAPSPELVKLLTKRVYDGVITQKVLEQFTDLVRRTFANHINDVISVSESKKIPFMVYTTRLFRDRHPELQKRIENAVNHPYRTDSIMYTVMDVTGVETVNGVSYKHKSLFK